jgi:hypothetical protein
MESVRLRHCHLNTQLHSSGPLRHHSSPRSRLLSTLVVVHSFPTPCILLCTQLIRYLSMCIATGLIVIPLPLNESLRIGYDATSRSWRYVVTYRRWT